MTGIILICDAETNILNVGEDAVGRFEGSPFAPDNHIVSWGIKRLGENKVHTLHQADLPNMKAVQTYFPHRVLGLSSDSNLRPWDSIMLVGHNIKFDLLYLLKDSPSFRAGGWPKIRIWDTMLVEYLITGQSSQFASLNKCAGKYGGTQKDDKIKEYWDAGIDTADIPKEELLMYMKEDVMNTELVFMKQMEIVKKLKMMPLCRTQMDGLKATTEMEFNGMHFDKVKAEALGKDCLEQADAAKAAMLGVLHTAKIFNHYYLEHEWKINSTESTANILFGGCYKYDISVPMLGVDGSQLRYKSGARKGEVRHKKELRVSVTMGFGVVAKSGHTTESGKRGVSTDVLKDILKELPRRPGSPPLVSPATDALLALFIDALLVYRGHMKDYKTYYVGYSDLTWHDNCLHPSLNHVKTDTGRLSCSKPNVQNASQPEDY